MLKYDRININNRINKALTLKKCKETSKKCNLCKFY